MLGAGAGIDQRHTLRAALLRLGHPGSRQRDRGNHRIPRHPPNWTSSASARSSSTPEGRGKSHLSPPFITGAVPPSPDRGQPPAKADASVPRPGPCRDGRRFAAHLLDEVDQLAGLGQRSGSAVTLAAIRLTLPLVHRGERDHGRLELVLELVQGLARGGHVGTFEHRRQHLWRPSRPPPAPPDRRPGDASFSSAAPVPFPGP